MATEFCKTEVLKVLDRVSQVGLNKLPDAEYKVLLDELIEALEARRVAVIAALGE